MRYLAMTVSMLLGLLAAPAAAYGPTVAVLSTGAAVAESQAEEAAQPSVPIVELSKKCPPLRYLGRDATFEITVTNRGGAAAHNVVVTDVVAGPIEFTGADNGGVREGNNVVWRLGTLGAGETKLLKANFRCNTIGTIRNTATVTYCVEASDSCELEVRGIPAILLECVDDPDPIEKGGTVNYTITVTNQGTAVGTNIVIACTLPPELEYVSAAGPTDVRADGKSVKFAPLPSLAPQARAVYKVSAKGVQVGDVRFHVELTSDQLTTPVMETESTHVY